MTAAAGNSTEVPRPDIHEMVIIHRAFRRESRLLAALIADVPAGDTARARVLAGSLPLVSAWRAPSPHRRG
jgi:hypothetical protein